MPRLWRESLAPMMITSSPSSRALADNSFHLASNDASSVGLGFSCGFLTSAGHASPPTARRTARPTAVTISHRFRFTITYSYTEYLFCSMNSFENFGGGEEARLPNTVTHESINREPAP